MYEDAFGEMGAVQNAAHMSTSEMLRKRFGHDDSASITTSVCNELRDLYERFIKPMEKTYAYEKYKDSFPLSASYFDSKPLILVVGPKFSGKTTFIRRMVGRNYPGMEIGMDNANNTFTVLCHDHDENLLPGQVVVTNEKYHFQELIKFGRPFLERFNMSTCQADILKDLWFVDTPRIDTKMANKDRDALMWFAARATRIILLFDPKKLEFNSEMQSNLHHLSNFQKKFCVVLNKSNGLHEMQLVKHYGTLMWNMCHVLKATDRKEELSVYVTSFSLENKDFNYNHRCAEMFDKDAQALMDDLYELPNEYTKQKLNTVGKRGKKVMFHAKLMMHLKDKLPKMFGKRSAQFDMKNNINNYLEDAANKLNVKPSFYAYMERKKHLLQTDNMKDYKRNKKGLEKIQALIGMGIPVLLKELQGISNDYERDTALIGMGLKKGKAKKLKAKKKKQLKAKKKQLLKLQRSRAGSIESTASKRSVLSSVASIRDKVKGTFNFIRRRKNRRKSTDGESRFSPGSIMDDAISTVYGGQRAMATTSGRRQYGSKNRKSGPSLSPRSIVEQSVHDENIDLYTVISDMDDDIFSITSNRTKVKAGKVNSRPKLLDASEMLHTEPSGDDDWAVPHPIRLEAKKLFEEHSTGGGLESDVGFQVLAHYNPQDRVVRGIWELVDFKREGTIDVNQCAVAIFLLKQVKGKKKIPSSLAPNLIPPNHRHLL